MQSLPEIFQELNLAHFGGRLPLPTLRWNPRLSTTAGRFCPGSRIPGHERRPEIEVASYLREIEEGALHVRDTILHEMVHYHLWHERRPHGHTAEFHRILRRVGGKRYNPVPKLRPIKHWYECPGCLRKIPARRRLAESACLPCCERFNGGRYTPRFRLRPAAILGGGVDGAEDKLAGEGPTPAAGRSAAKPSAEPGLRHSPSPAPERKLSVVEVIRRLEELKNLVTRRGD